MKSRLNHIFFITVVVMIAGCTTSHHGTFIPSTYIDPEDKRSVAVAKVTGESKQKWILYIFPLGKAPSTDDAIRDAKSKTDGTKYLTDIAVDDRMYWKIGYSEQVIEVKATAHR